jgi:glycosyltransferase involved in cell wall biosynthesis
MASERVVIGVVPRDRLSMFPRCLEALYAHTDGLFRVVLVAGGVDSATRQQLESLQTQHDNLSVLLTDRLLEQAAVRNLVLRHVHERVCVLLENDTLVQTNWLPPLLECMREERAAVVAPLLLDFWEGTIHTAGGTFEERQQDGAVEPLDADLGLTLRRRGLTAFLEPRSRATYITPPPLHVGDISVFKFRWDAEAWAVRNRRFMHKWRVSYEGARKQLFYRRQYRKLGLARWYPRTWTVWWCNASLGVLKYLRSRVRRWRNSLPVGKPTWLAL